MDKTNKAISDFADSINHINGLVGNTWKLEKCYNCGQMRVCSPVRVVEDAEDTEGYNVPFCRKCIVTLPEEVLEDNNIDWSDFV